MTHLQGQRLEGMLAQLADQVTALARAGSAAVVPGKPVRLLPRPAFLAGREELLADVGLRLAGGDGRGPRIVVLYGLGGAGKTSVAVEYVHRHLGEVGVAWQFAAEDAAVLAAGFGELAAQLGVRGCLKAGTRWRRCTRCWPPIRRGGCWCSTTVPARLMCSSSCPRLGTVGS